jgi:hypothetical protein
MEDEGAAVNWTVLLLDNDGSFDMDFREGFCFERTD